MGIILGKDANLECPLFGLRLFLAGQAWVSVLAVLGCCTNQRAMTFLWRVGRNVAEGPFWTA